jgi:hypothetical protein
MKFFIPQTAPAETEAAYQRIKAILLDQFRLPIQDRRIFSLSYTNSKRRWKAEVGQPEQQERRYDIVAIFESKQFIIYTRAKTGGAGPIILVNKTEVTAVEDFQ